MTPEETKIVAIVESMLIWDELSRTGGNNKLGVVRKLYKERKISSNQYNLMCPLCNEYWDPSACHDCPWPGVGHTRCERGLYGIWAYLARNNEDRMKYAKRIFEMLSEVEI